MRAAVLVPVLAAALAGCTSTVGGSPVPGGPVAADRELVLGYFEARNAAAEEGSAAQEQFFADTQHPDARGEQCGLDGVVLVSDPALTTLRADPDWVPPEGDGPPRGTTYVVAVSVVIEDGAVEVGTQIGSQHVVVLDGAAYGFAPCPT